jgi:hypothetical protein
MQDCDEPAIQASAEVVLTSTETGRSKLQHARTTDVPAYFCGNCGADFEDADDALAHLPDPKAA